MAELPCILAIATGFATGIIIAINRCGRQDVTMEITQDIPEPNFFPKPKPDHSGFNNSKHIDGLTETDSPNAVDSISSKNSLDSNQLSR